MVPDSSVVTSRFVSFLRSRDFLYPALIGVVIALSFLAWVPSLFAAGLAQPFSDGAYTISGGQDVHASDRSSIYGTPTEILETVTFTIENYGTATCADASNNANAYTGVNNPSDPVAVSIPAGTTQDVTYTWTASAVELDDVASWVPYADGGDDMTGGGCLYRYRMSDTSRIGAHADTKAFGYATKDFRMEINGDSFDTPLVEPSTNVTFPEDGDVVAAGSLYYEVISSLSSWQNFGPQAGVFDIQVQKWDGDSYEDYWVYTRNWAGQYIGSGWLGVSGVSPANNDLNFPQGLYQIRAKSSFVGYDAGDWSAWNQFTMSTSVAPEVGNNNAAGTVNADFKDFYTFAPPECDLGEDWLGFFTGLIPCATSFLKWIVIPDEQTVKSVVRTLDINNDFWPVAYVTVPLTAFDEGTTAGYSAGCVGGSVDFGAGVFSGAVFDYCDVLEDVGDFVGTYALWVVALIVTIGAITLAGALSRFNMAP